MEPHRIGRREFMTRTASGLAGLAVATSGITASDRALGANERLSVGVIGNGARSRDLIREIAGVSKDLNVEVTALCDVWKVHLAQASGLVKELFGREPRTFVGYEDLLALDDIDAVVIATPDFHHAPIMTDAARAGKDVYCEKPMATDLGDALAAIKAVEENGRVVQVGTQRRSEGICRAGAAFVQSGALGRISRVEAAWNDCAPRWRRNPASVKESVKEEDLDWKRYLGKLKYRPFDPHQFREWHLYRDFTKGTTGLLGSHMIDLVHWFMADPLPVSAVAHGGNFAWNDGREHEDTVYALLEYPKGFLLRYCSGLGNSSGNGCYFYGTKGSFDTETWKAAGVGGGSDKITEEIRITPMPGEGHMRNFLECVRSRKRPNVDIYAGYAHSVVSIMVERALRSGRKVLFDSTNNKMQEI